jgi:hypothetical protein
VGGAASAPARAPSDDFADFAPAPKAPAWSDGDDGFCRGPGVKEKLRVRARFARKPQVDEHSLAL